MAKKNGSLIRALKTESMERRSNDELAAKANMLAMGRGSVPWDAPDASKQLAKRKKEADSAENSKLRIGLSDLGGSAAAQGLNEGWSYLMRVAGKASVDGFMATQNDYLQASLPAVGGLIWYLIELFGVSRVKAPSGFKMGRMEAAKMLGNLGLSKFLAALRSRTAETKKELEGARADAQRVLADNKVMADNLQKLHQQLLDMAKKQGGGSGGQ